MGNSQSNTQEKNYKIYEIIKVDSFDDDRVWWCSVALKLHDYITYKDKNCKHIFLKGEGYRSCKVGDYLKIDLNAVKCEKSNNIFEWTSVISKKLIIIKRDLAKEAERDSNGNFIKFVCDTGEFLGELMRNRESYQASVLDARASNYGNLRQTSYDMPPNWK